MNLLFDLFTTQETALTRVHGGGVYGQAFFAELCAANFWKQNGIRLSVVTRAGAALPDSVQQAVQAHADEVVAVDSHAGILKAAAEKSPDVLYTPVPYWLAHHRDQCAGLSVPIKGTVHGIRTVGGTDDPLSLQYQRNPLKRLYQRLIRVPKRAFARRKRDDSEAVLRALTGGMLTVSLHSKYQIIAEFPFVTPEQVSVVYSIDQPLTSAQPDPLPDSVVQPLANRPYFLLLNANRPVKNALRVIVALERYRPPALEAYAFVCVGFSSAQRDYIRRAYPLAHRQIVHVPYCERSVLDSLFAHAYALVFPSKNEGFGYPPLEAMRVGTPAVCSAATAIPETCADAVLYFQPTSNAEIINRLLQIVSESELRANLIRRGTERYQRYASLRAEQVKRFGAFLLSPPPAR
ncbi:MAG: glycosyltransferase [Spirochaetaceae bacterium]|nr:MAG: glycosyltransferase [Spirochaetaceae bacterium]